MAKNKLPDFNSLEKLTDFFDDNDMGDYWQAMPEVDFEITIAKKTRLVAIEETLADRLAKVAREKHMSPEVLIQAWLKEKLEISDQNLELRTK
jgi:CopG antitoxin of type II toxin-antitoxin system